ncbi:MAG: MFS transporter [Candidatus Azobacteroides sp.]|nr:MFS transporter [Candidatus Azobacteroides sp.]
MKIKGLRWWIISLIVLVTLINYLDRNTLSIMWQGIVADLGLIDKESLSPEEYTQQSKEMYSYIYMFFMVAYGISQMLSGKLYDKIGTRIGFVISVTIWAVADALTAFARGLGSLSFFRAMLGLGEAGPWPGAVKSNAEWFPVKERAFAQGLFNAGASVGAIISPILIALLYTQFGWQMTFIIIGVIGLLWLIPWLVINKKGPKYHEWITQQEKEYILSGQLESTINNEKGLSWGELVKNKKSWSVIAGRFFLDPVWWMFVAWLPIYLLDVHGFDIKSIGMYAGIPYIGAMIGSLLGGWFSGNLIKKGKSVNYARKAAMIIGAIIMFPSLIATGLVSDVRIVIALMVLILLGFQFAIGNIQTLPSDLFSGKTVGSLAGLGGAAATLGVILSMVFIPSLTKGGNWLPFFILGAALVPLAIGSVFFFGGKIERQ